MTLGSPSAPIAFKAMVFGLLASSASAHSRHVGCFRNMEFRTTQGFKRFCTSHEMPEVWQMRNGPQTACELSRIEDMKKEGRQNWKRFRELIWPGHRTHKPLISWAGKPWSFLILLSINTPSGTFQLLWSPGNTKMSFNFHISASQNPLDSPYCCVLFHYLVLGKYTETLPLFFLKTFVL